MQNYKENLAKWIKPLVTSRFLRWWLGELSSMMPGWLRQDGPGVDDFTLVAFDRTELVLSSREGGRIREVCRLPLKPADAAGQRNAFLGGLDKAHAGRRDVALKLPSDRVLRKTISMPLATEENLRQVLAFQMEQLTPFAAAQVYFGYRVSGRDFERGQLTVEFVVAPRDAVDETLGMLAGWGAQVRAVIAGEMLAQGNPVNMLPAAQGRTPSPLLHGANPWLAGLILLLILAALIMPLVIKREAVRALQPWVEKAKLAAEAVDTLRRELETRVEQHNYLLEKKRALPPVITVLEELTRVLPDDTWVQQMDIKGKELQIQGETASSSRLIGLFEQSSIIRDASFRSPLTKGQGAGTEHYHLALEIHSLPTPPAQAPAPKGAAQPVPAVKPQPAAATDAAKADNKQPAPVAEKKP